MEAPHECDARPRPGTVRRRSVEAPPAEAALAVVKFE